LIYLDNAATTLEKPPAVARAMINALGNMTTPGRGGHRPAMAAAASALSCREEAAALFDVPDPAQIVFTCNATHGLNIAIRTLVKPGDVVLISGYEHNAVTRPLHAIPDVTIKVARATLFDRYGALSAFQELLTPDVSVVIVNHVSNVFGFVQPVEAIAHLCQIRGVPLIVDASQSAGCLPISMRQLKAAFIAMPGHKGLYGPQGTGLLLCGVQPEPVLSGGTGSDSVYQGMPTYLPDRLEAGTHNMPGIAGLLEGLRFVRRLGPDQIRTREHELMQKMSRGLMEIPGVRVFWTGDPACQVGVLSFQMEGWDCEALGEWFAQREIAVRAGLHCAPLAHESVGTMQAGTVRASVGVYTTKKQVIQFLDEVKKAGK